MTNLKKALIISIIIILIDQVVKFWIKTHMFIGESIPVIGKWAIIQFTENNGMAFGMEFGGEFGKIFLSIFRIVAVAGISWMMYDLAKKKATFGILFSLALILAGAIGNILDSAFYGILFSESGFIPGQEAIFLPANGGYASFLHGKVVDMLFFPIIEGHFPTWFPIWEGESFMFFRPIFNIADSAITVGVFSIVIFQRSFFQRTQSVAVN